MAIIPQIRAGPFKSDIRIQSENFSQDTLGFTFFTNFFVNLKPGGGDHPPSLFQPHPGMFALHLAIFIIIYEKIHR